ncbi:hypothetical protein SAICODRAFT_27123 [Saitoella complicata NRRL Y-17804]|uniref:Uncharacterized protein n=1 Tax=Saitoella complicata (strain BCRC 22490 / CBS 7301 / JCM 7358 / NBRC 10748 / NRRL Y-17804) TaxID=698492 RepID=A0A0E9NMY4_SAICN|nr:uncharacterized protein SAICODRAFT_27123 [Saitoella complicata NRRL Y-17804]ODQ51069.1 hypothetical protein SAICODRAFT_27123 [Saitoella complicata NRRL Y-17804]GAO51237.1 hypothetical protein G7K_5345-t1 [Saitoella complicata NRRL Y-17804]
MIRPRALAALPQHLRALNTTAPLPEVNTLSATGSRSVRKLADLVHMTRASVHRTHANYTDNNSPRNRFRERAEKKEAETGRFDDAPTPALELDMLSAVPPVEVPRRGQPGRPQADRKQGSRPQAYQGSRPQGDRGQAYQGDRGQAYQGSRPRPGAGKTLVARNAIMAQPSRNRQPRRPNSPLILRGGNGRKPKMDSIRQPGPSDYVLPTISLATLHDKLPATPASKLGLSAALMKSAPSVKHAEIDSYKEENWKDLEARTKEIAALSVSGDYRVELDGTGVFGEMDGRPGWVKNVIEQVAMNGAYQSAVRDKFLGVVAASPASRMKQLSA